MEKPLILELTFKLLGLFIPLAAPIIYACAFKIERKWLFIFVCVGLATVVEGAFTLACMPFVFANLFFTPWMISAGRMEGWGYLFRVFEFVNEWWFIAAFFLYLVLYISAPVFANRYFGVVFTKSLNKSQQSQPAAAGTVKS